MKIKKLLFAAVAMLAFSACTDAPESPFNPGGGNTGGNGGTTVTGDNLLKNSSFETWADGKPTNWGLTVTNGTYSQSTEANTGESAVLLSGNASANKRLASKSYTLTAGKYTLAAHLKQSGDNFGQFRLGYAKLTDGVVADTQNDYIYLTSAAAVTANWKQTAVEFTLEAETELAIIIMNSKYGSGAAILVDDVILTTVDGGIVEGTDSEEPETPTEKPEGTYISESFAASLGSFTTQQTVGNYPWVNDYSTAKATSYVDTDGDNKADTDKEATSWLVSPAVDFTEETEAYVAFEYIIRYSESGKVAENHQLLISSDYTGDVATATWTNIPYNAVEGTDWQTFYKANVAVPAEFLGKANITFAFRYTATTKAGTWEVRNLIVAHGAATGETPEQPETPENPEPETPEEPETPDTPVVPTEGNILENSSFEEWNGSNPTGWGEGNIGHKSTISQSTDACDGNYAVVVNGSAQNMRLASKSYTLPAGTYTIAAYIKQSGSAAGAFKLGYGIIKDGAIANSDYKYQTNATTVTNEWELYTYEFTLTQETLITALVMNSKNGGGNAILVDNVTITAK
jgi:hypothetical protein